MDSKNIFKEEFIKKCNLQNCNIEPIQGDASTRKYDRITNAGTTYILMDSSTDLNAIQKFVNVTKVFQNLNLSIPEIFEYDLENGFLLAEDFGNASLKNVITNRNIFFDYPEETRIYERAIDVLIYMHKNSENISLPESTNKSFIEGSLLLIEWYISVLNAEKIVEEQQQEFVEIFEHLLKYLEIFPKVISHKDYHSENLYWLDNQMSLKKIGIIDFQDAKLCCPVYDLVSLLEDARYQVPEAIVDYSISRYLKSFPQYTRKDFMAAYSVLSLQRNLRIIGNFTRQASLHKKTQYLTMLPTVWKYVHNSLKHPLLFPLKKWLDTVLPTQARQNTFTATHQRINA